MREKTGFPAILLAFSILLTLLGGCGVSKDQVMGVIAPTTTPQAEVQHEAITDETEEEIPLLTLSCSALTGCFSPFWAEADGDRLVVDATQLSLLAEEGLESPTVISRTINDDGSVTVSIEIRGGLRFADGEPVDADDLLFTYYVLLDPSYDGPCDVNTLPIRGMEEYYHGVPDALYEKYAEMYDEIYADGHYDEALQKALQEAQDAVPHNSWDEQQAQKAVDEYDAEKAEQIKAALLEYWRKDVDRLVDFCLEKFGTTVEYRTGYSLDEVKANRGLQVMFAMVELNYGALSGGVLVNNSSASTWDLRTEFPTADDLFLEFYNSYGGNAETYYQIEGIGRRNFLEEARDSLIAAWAAEDEDWTGPVKRMAGIERVGDRLITVTLDYYDTAFVDTLCDIYIAPLHWYGDTELYRYSEGSYGFVPGDLSTVKEKNGQPLGAGAFVLEEWDVNTASLSLNGDYWTTPPLCSGMVISVGP